LVIGIFAIIDAKNSEVMSGLKPFMVGLTFIGVGTSFGLNTGYALNPARDLSPRIFTAMAGWGKDVFEYVTNKKNMALKVDTSYIQWNLSTKATLGT